MDVLRCPENPIIKPKDVRPSRNDFEIIGVFNAGVARFNDEVILLLRVAERPINDNDSIVLTALYNTNEKDIVIKEFSKDNFEIDFSDPRLITTNEQIYLTSISHLRLARSTDGINFQIDEIPTINPENEFETFGLEDPRITFIDGVYYIHYVSVCEAGVTTSLISTADFNTYKRHGAIFCPDNKDVAIFAGKINGKYYALHRPSTFLSRKQRIWLAESSDLINWGNHRPLISPGFGSWDNCKIGAGSVPFETDKGWLEIYHGVDSGNRYSLGAVLLDKHQPWKVISRTDEPILQPQTNYECEGFFGNVVFSCGLLCENNKLKIYYGAADTNICYAELSIDYVFKKLKSLD